MEGADAAGAREARARALLDALPVAVYTTDRAGRIIYYNEAAAAFWGHRPRLGTDHWCGSWRLFWPDGTPMPHDQCPMAAALRENRPIRGDEAIAERPDGTRVPFIPFPTPLRDPHTGALVGAVNMLVDITERKAAEAALREREARLTLLAAEVDHRARNMLATIQAIARMTRADTVPAYRRILNGRISALARVHALLAESRWTGADLRRLAEEELLPFDGPEGRRTAISGPALSLGPDPAQAVAMVLHELAANAARHGALSTPTGRVRVAWRWAEDGRLALEWNETGGPPVPGPPAQRGFGIGLVEATATGQLDARVHLDWRREGLFCRLSIPRSKVLDGCGAGPLGGLPQPSL
jgi:PAS domain S-box-containing protein